MRTFVLLRLLLDHVTYGGVDPLCVFHLYLKKVADIIAPKLSIIFRRLIRLGSFSKFGCLIVRRQIVTVVGDGAESEWIPIVSGVPREVCWVLFCLSYIPAKCFNWLRTEYLPTQMTRHYWQLFTSQQTDLLLLPPLTGTLLGFKSGAIIGA